ncbi:MAG TPA: universal stress protein [Kofleriaceae bacterium]
MTHGRTRRYRIVVGVDLTEYSTMVIEHALDQAARHQTPELHFVHVKESRKHDINTLGEYLSAAVYPSLQVFNEYGTDWRARLHIRQGKPDEQITMLAADILADMIVIGDFGLHRKGTPKRVLAHAICPTLVVGMPKVLDTRQCGECAVLREDSDGTRWFCDDHRVKHNAVSPMTTWTAGNLARAS